MVLGAWRGMIGRDRAMGLRASRRPRRPHYIRIAVRAVPIGTWYRRPGLVRRRARPSPSALRDVGAIPGARLHPLVFDLRRNATPSGTTWGVGHGSRNRPSFA